MKHYRLDSIRTPNGWRVVHKATGAVLTPLGPLNTCNHDDALEWINRAERVAPTDSADDAGRLLVADGYPQDWRARAMALVGM